MNNQKNTGLGFLLLCVLCGVGIGLLITILCSLGGFSGDIVVAVILTIMAVLLIGLCLYPIFSNFKNHLILKKGVQVEGKILEVVNTIASPLYYRPGDNGELVPIGDMACIPAMYVLRLTYTVQGKTVEKEFPPTLERTAGQLLPFKMEAGAVLPVICLSRNPKWALIAIPGILEATLATQKSTVKYGVLGSLLVLLLYQELLFGI